ncbi:MAG: glycosyltransferase family 1 protein [Gemmatimonadales bacterium]|nr:glycosyltransferase family 1 protein [Gemmatimonadales bacterium]
MRIALFSEVYWPMVSGVAVTLGRLHDALVARGHAVRVYTATYPLPGDAGDRPEVFRCPSRALFVAPEVQWAFPRRREIIDDLAAFRPDVVHLATEFAMGFAGLRAAQAVGAPIVASAHTDYERYASRYGLSLLVAPGWHYLRWFYDHAACVLAPTRLYEAHLRSRGVRRTGIWSRGVDAAHFSPAHRSAAFRDACGAGPDDVLVSYVGRLAPEKGIPVLLDAWERLGARRAGAKLVFVGDGLLEPEIRRRDLPGVHLAGVLRGRPLAEAYASADVFAFPSTTETFGNVVLEAMASGLTTVVPSVGGQVEFAEDGVNALHVAPDDPAALAETLARTIADRALRERLGAAARATALARDWDSIFDGLCETYAAAAGAEADQAVAA